MKGQKLKRAIEEKSKELIQKIKRRRYSALTLQEAIMKIMQIQYWKNLQYDSIKNISHFERINIYFLSSFFHCN